MANFRIAVAVGLAVAVMGCGGGSNNSSANNGTPSTQPIVHYPTLPSKKVPDYLKGTILEFSDLGNTEPELVSGYGLVVNLEPGAGDTKASQVIRDYMIKEMAKRGFGSALMPGFQYMTPEAVLADPHHRVAITEAYAYLPPGVREGQMFDVQVSAMMGNDTKSLAHGQLYRCDLKENGANPIDPQGAIYVKGRSQGDVFINPALSMSTSADNTSRASRRTGLILDGGEALVDRPLVLRLRSPQWSVSRRIGRRIAEFFAESDTIAAASYDEAIVNMVVPKSFKGDWEHFAGVATHLYLLSDPGSVNKRAKALAEAALKPDAPLMDISYAFEGLGTEALPFLRPLMQSNKPDVAFAAIRAAAFIGESTAPSALVQIARTPSHPFQINAVQVLGAMRTTPAVNGKLRELLNTDQAQVRIEAYRVLAASHDPSLFSQVINEKFVLDVVPSSGPPLIYCSRRGTPRIALLGSRPSVSTPLTFTTMAGNLMLSSIMEDRAVMIYYRGSDVPHDKDTHLAKAIKIVSRTDVAELVGWLGGMRAPDTNSRLDFTYGDVVSVLQSLTDAHHIAAGQAGQRIAANFVLQDIQGFQEKLNGAPPLEPKSRPQADATSDAR